MNNYFDIFLHSTRYSEILNKHTRKLNKDMSKIIKKICGGFLLMYIYEVFNEIILPMISDKESEESVGEVIFLALNSILLILFIATHSL